MDNPVKDVREELRRREERQRLALRAGRIAGWDHDLTSGAVVWLEGSEAVFGRKPEEFGGTFDAFLDLVDADDRARVAEIVRQAAACSGDHETEFRVAWPDGGVHWVSARAHVVHDAVGRPARVIGVAVEITDRKRAEEALRQSEERFARFMQHLPGLAWIKDRQGRYVYANDAAENAFQKRRAELYGRTDDEVFPPDTAARFKANDRRALDSGAGVQAIETLEHADGVIHHSIVSKFAIPGPAGEAALVGGVAFDITDRIRAEENLRDADRRKNEFLAMLAHELRNPLAPIRNAVHILKLPQTDAAQAEQVRAMIERQAQHLARLVDDLLDVSRVMRGKIELRPEAIDLAAVIARAVETAQPDVAAQGHRFTLTLPPEPVRLHGDPVRLAQVFANLLHNAAKYTDGAGQIWLCVEREGEEAVIRVRDTGIGISRDLLPHVFELFVQGDRSVVRSRGGLGIGLTLVKRLVELHGGSVVGYSAGPGQGSEFVVRLPLWTDEGGRMKDELKPACIQSSSFRPHPSKRVLVVDDNVDAAGSLALLLRLSGHAVQTVTDGPAALALAPEFRPQVILLDIGLPGMDGYEVAQRLRELPDLARTRLVAVTGYGQDEDRRRSAEAGFDVHLTKPVDPDELARVLTFGS